MQIPIPNSWRQFWQGAILQRRKGLSCSVARSLCTSLSMAVSGAVLIRRRLYRVGFLPVHTLKARVISVGNVSMGGTGKTPVVSLVAGHLEAEGKRVVILTRGYGRMAPGQRILVGGNGHWRKVGDEPLMLSRSLPTVPIVVGRDRVAGGKLAVDRFQPRFVILDDGLQHLRLARDVEMVVIDATCPFGNGRLFPGGILREDLGALRRASLFFLTRVNQAEGVENLVDLLRESHPQTTIVQGAFEPKSLRYVGSQTQLSLESLRGEPVLAMSGIGNPLSFEQSLEQLGAQLIQRVRFPDHHAFSRKELAAAVQLAQVAGARYLVTTEKDEVRLPTMQKLAVPLLSLAIQLKVVSGERQLWKLIERGF